ncbi:DUF397 domain-containing protein [Actinomadura sp. 3N508]|uniref:DUF397 domain-containing protein n=1 Tax=Actinomadura sp. 3N508 TaxID=3375153 RepID=UPI0037BD9BAE
MNVVNLSSCIWRKSSRSDSSGAECVEVASIPVKWHKSSHSTGTGGQCVEVAPMVPISSAEWKKSSRSDNTGGQCVEVADLAAAVAVRDSKDPDGPKLVFGPAAWQAFASKVKAGTLDLA